MTHVVRGKRNMSKNNDLKMDVLGVIQNCQYYKERTQGTLYQALFFVTPSLQKEYFENVDFATPSQIPNAR